MSFWAWISLLSCGPDAAEVTPASPVAITETAWTRERRRMNVDQLKASMEAVAGVGWTEVQSGETVDLFESLAVTLGKPDYLASTEEELSPGLLFQKFLDDAAKSICAGLVETDPWRADGERTLFVYADLDTRPGDPEVEENARAALLRFHGRVLPAGDPQLEPWVGLFEAGFDATGDPAASWQLVCVALFTHPDFYSY